MTEKFMPLIIFGVALAIAMIVRHVAVNIIRRRLSERSHFAAVCMDAIRGPSWLWCPAIALVVALRYAPLNEHQIELANKLIVAFLIASVSLVASNVAIRMLTLYGERNSLPFAVAGLSRTLTRILIYSLAGMILLRHFNISITPLLTALGVGGLAVALALQDTLANFFAGVHILVEKPLGLGDYIKLGEGQEGVVTDIGWRTTRIRTGANTLIVIPNTKITSGILTNCSLPNQRVSAEVAILAGQDADVDTVAQLAMDAAAETEGVLTEFPAVVVFDPGMLATHMELKLVVQVASQLARGPVQSELRVRLLKKMRERSVPLPSVMPGQNINANRN